MQRERGSDGLAVPDAGVLLAGRYRLDEQIAVGGTGQVWRAADTVLGRAVAIKLLRPEYAGHAETLARFRAEARHAAQAAGHDRPGVRGAGRRARDRPGAPGHQACELAARR